jgi:DNA-binding protein H-NS
MSKLTALRKKIAQLEAEYARAAEVEMREAVGKVRGLMASLGVTLEHLGAPSSSVSSKRAAPSKASAKSAAPKRAGVGVPKYMDPKTGKTWTGFGRAPAWIASVKNREAFLVGKSVSAATPIASTKAFVKNAKKRNVKAAAPAKKASARDVAAKSNSVKARAMKSSAVKKVSKSRPANSAAAVAETGAAVDVAAPASA